MSNMTTTETALRTLDFAANSSTTFKVRMFEIDGAPWFVATDVCRSLGLDVTGGSTNHLKKLDADERQPVPLNLVRGWAGVVPRPPSSPSPGSSS